jgi:transcriptional regulator with XRE-family HTH domain
MTQLASKLGRERFPGFGERLRIAMRRAGHGKLASLALELGVTESSLSRWCSGHDISLSNAVALSKCLKVSLDWLVTGVETVPPMPCPCGRERPSKEALASVGIFLQALVEPSPRTAERDRSDRIARDAKEFLQN